ncbi:MAG: LacI family transcriptional regulator, partial [Planctomycetota bacterium]|nr:LacI family transcriptional regulator [Planctomycetota bacterium]
MRTTIKDIAAMTGVSIATISHIINKTRYVSPELVEKVEKALIETGYTEKKKKNPASGLRLGKASEIALVVPNTHSVVYSQLIIELANRLENDGFILSAYFSSDDAVRERHILQQLMANRRIAGIVLAPVSDDAHTYEKLVHSGLPFICLERTFYGADIDSIVSDNVEGIYKGTKHLIKSGHENIILLLENRRHTTVGDKLKGYRQALDEYGVPFREDFVINIDLTRDLSYVM